MLQHCPITSQHYICHFSYLVSSIIDIQMKINSTVKFLTFWLESLDENFVDDLLL
jgi:hypothetical protein